MAVFSPTLARNRNFSAPPKKKEPEKPKCEFFLECYDLLDPFNHVDDVISTFASVSFSDKAFSAGYWMPMDCSATVRNNANPQYHDKKFCIPDSFSNDGSILIQIQGLHPANDMPVNIGSAEVKVRDMLQGGTFVRQLKCGTINKGHLIIFMTEIKEQDTDEVEWESIYSNLQLEDSMEDEVDDTNQNTHLAYFSEFLGVKTKKCYRVETSPHTSLSIAEEMFELSTSFSLAGQYMRMLISLEQQLVETLKGLENAIPEEEYAIAMLSRTTKLSQYEEELAVLGMCSADGFKRSELKGDPKYKWAPINLHAQVLEVNTIDASISSIKPCKKAAYCFITAGAMCAHWEKFKNGGLQSIFGDETSTEGEKFASYRLVLDHIAEVDQMLGDVTALTPADVLLLSHDDTIAATSADLQKSLNSTHQLEFIGLLADIERLAASEKTEKGSREILSGYLKYVKASLAWKLTNLELKTREQFLRQLHRYNCCFSQLLASVVSAFLLRLAYNFNDKILKRQLKVGVLPVMLESLLSTHGDEMGMLEDMWFVIKHLECVSLQFSHNTRSQNVTVDRICGNPFNITVIIALPEPLYSTLKHHKNLTFKPLFFSHGINEQQTIAYKMNETGLQDRICEVFMRDLEEYITSYVVPHDKHYPAHVTQGLSLSLSQLRTLLKVTKKNKSHHFIALSEQIGRDIGCMRLTSCKSAKDRTSMSVTYEYCNLLTKLHELPPEKVSDLLEEFRRDGTRYDNTFKNIGMYKYCFNKLQRTMLPSVYRPPPGTFGDGASHT